MTWPVKPPGGPRAGGGNPAQTLSHSPLSADKGVSCNYALSARPED
jgi:hypothetical protein